MKVLVLSSLAYSLVNFRFELLRGMVNKGYEVVACAPDKDPDVFKTLAAIGVEFRRVPMDRTGTNPLRDLHTLWTLIRLLRTERPDVVLAYTQKPIVYGGIACRIALRTSRFYAMVSGLGHAFSGENDHRPSLVRAVLCRLYRAATARARTVFVFNDCDAAEMRAYDMLAPSQHVVRVPGSGIDTEAFRYQPVTGSAPVFLLVARMLREKGIVEFIEAARLIRSRWPKARFQMLGWLDPGPRGITRNELDYHLEGSGVEYLGETRDVRPFLASATVFVLPTYYREGLPRTILEAMSMGRAVITSDTPGCRETVIPGFNGFLVPPRDLKALADAMEAFARTPGLAVTMGKRSRWLAVRRFDVRRVNQILLQTMFDQPETGGAVAGAQNRSLTDMQLVEAMLTLLIGLYLLPLAIVTGIIVRLALGRPILLVQQRAGRDGSTFPLIKFRTMSNARDETGRLLPDDQRLNRVGRMLRRLRLDEIPEICNILRGEMALIGPRPLLPQTLAAMGEDANRRGDVRPGLTGWAQVNGNTLLSQREKLALDTWYVAHRSIVLDMRIMWRTLVMLFGGERLNQVQIGRACASATDRGR